MPRQGRTSLTSSSGGGLLDGGSQQLSLSPIVPAPSAPVEAVKPPARVSTRIPASGGVSATGKLLLAGACHCHTFKES